MSLIELIAGVEAREQTLTVVSEDPAIREELAERLADRNLTVAAGTLEEGPDGFAILSENGDVLTVVTLDDDFERVDGLSIEVPLTDDERERLHGYLAPEP